VENDGGFIALLPDTWNSNGDIVLKKKVDINMVNMYVRWNKVFGFSQIKSVETYMSMRSFDLTPSATFSSPHLT
jgi:hypothetical protein